MIKKADFLEIFEDAPEMDEGLDMPTLLLEEEDDGSDQAAMPSDGKKGLPGALNTLEVEEDESEPVRETDWETDGDHGKFIIWLRKKVDEVPPHSGNTTVGCERAISYFKRLDRELSKAIQSDDKNVIDENEAEELRDMIFDYVSRLEEALDKLSAKKQKKKASIKIGKRVVARINDGTNIQYFVSVADDSGEVLLPVELDEPTDKQVTAFVNGEKGFVREAGQHVYFFEDPFLHAITKIMINAHITQGKNLDEVYAALDDKYKFTDRENLSIQELLIQKGLPLNKDLGRIGDKEFNTFDGKGIMHATTYPA